MAVLLQNCLIIYMIWSPRGEDNSQSWAVSQNSWKSAYYVASTFKKSYYIYQDRETLATKRKMSMEPYLRVSDEERMMSLDQFYQDDLTIPTRPPWDYGYSKHKLEEQEQAYFKASLFIHRYGNSHCGCTELLNWFTRNWQCRTLSTGIDCWWLLVVLRSSP